MDYNLFKKISNFLQNIATFFALLIAYSISKPTHFELTFVKPYPYHFNFCYSQLSYPSWTRPKLYPFTHIDTRTYIILPSPYLTSTQTYASYLSSPKAYHPPTYRNPHTFTTPW